MGREDGSVAPIPTLDLKTHEVRCDGHTHPELDGSGIRYAPEKYETERLRWVSGPVPNT